MFDKAMEFVGRWEWGSDKDGGYTNDPADPGGETRWGVSKKAHPKLDIKNLTYEQAKEIYAETYWKPFSHLHGDFPLSVAAFDSGVNCGVGRTLRWLDEAKNTEELLAIRALHYHTIACRNPKLRKFVKGWFNRLFDLHDFTETLKEQKL